MPEQATTQGEGLNALFALAAAAGSIAIVMSLVVAAI